MTLQDALDAADLTAAIETATAQVKSGPTDHDARRLLIDLNILAGRFEAADKQADVLSRIAPDLAVGLSLLRGRLRAARARVEWFANGAVPSFVDAPTERDEMAMRLAVAERAGEPTGELVAAMDAASETEMVVNGETALLRDADARVPHALEVLASDGSYMWIDLATIAGVTFEPPQALRDVAWRRAELHLKDGSQTEVVVCATYHAAQGETDAHRLARETDWAETDGLVTGIGQKAYLVGDDVTYALDLESLSENPGA